MRVRWGGLVPLTALFLLLLTPFAHARDPALRVVFFTADWCPNCRVLAPKLEQAIARTEDVERIDIDITDARRWDESLERALDRRVLRLYNAYVGTTGFAVIAAADTGETIACVTAVYESAAIEAALDRAHRRLRTAPPHARATGRSLACPEERAPPP